MSYEADIMSFVGERVSREAAAIVVRRADAEIAALKKERDGAALTCGYVENQAKHDREEIERLNTRIGELDRQVAAYASEMGDSEASLAASQTRVRELEAAIVAKDAAIATSIEHVELGDAISLNLLRAALSPTIGQDTLARMEAAEAVCEGYSRERRWVDTGDYTGEEFEANGVKLTADLEAYRAIRAKGAKNG